MPAERLFHIVAAPDWDTALISGTYVPASYETDGFVHLSHRHQVTGAANRFYRDYPDLVVVELDSTLLGADVVEEDLYGAGETFPHLYAPVPTSAARAVHPLPRDSDGGFYFPA